MSGGYFNYDQYKIDGMAAEIEELIATNGSKEIDEWGGSIGNNYPPEIIDRFQEAVTTLRRAAAMAQRVDWLVSGDDGEESFMRRWDEELAKLEAPCAN